MPHYCIARQLPISHIGTRNQRQPCWPRFFFTRRPSAQPGNGDHRGLQRRHRARCRRGNKTSAVSEPEKLPCSPNNYQIRRNPNLVIPLARHTQAYFGENTFPEILRKNLRRKPASSGPIQPYLRGQNQVREIPFSYNKSVFSCHR